MNKDQHYQIIDRKINEAFPSGKISPRVEHYIHQIAQYAFVEGRNYALEGLMTVRDVALHFQVSERRARVLVRNRHERFGTGRKVGNQWLVHQDELEILTPSKNKPSGGG